MPQTFLNIRGIDPLLFRDGRPFTADAGGLTARSLPLPMPTTVAAFVRTQIGREMGWNWTHNECIEGHTICVYGPLLARDGELVLPAPKDALLARHPNDTLQARARPLIPTELEAGGCDLPGEMRPVTLAPSTERGATASTSDEGKPPKDFDYWPRQAMLDWLEEKAPTILPKIGGLPEDERTGIEMDSDTGRSKDGRLYTARLRAFGENGLTGRHEYALVARVNLPNGLDIRRQGTLGGERRLTVIEQSEDTSDIWPRCPQSLKDKLSNATRVRMVLATPARFGGGWRPDWTADEKSGSGLEHLPAGIGKVRLKLVGASIDRRVPVSGWGLREPGPRAIRWLVPAGGVYFFEVTGGDPSALYEDAWMKPMSDNEQDRRDGLGLALWGTY